MQKEKSCMKILYFTATGNSLHVAKRIGGELLSIPRLQKNNCYEIADDVVGIVCPVYCFDVPLPVRNYLKNAKIKAEYVFILMTCGNDTFAALHKMTRQLQRNDTQVHYANEIKMVDNYLPLYETANQIAAKNNADIESKIDSIINDIKEKKHFCLKPNFTKSAVSNILSPFLLSRAGKKLLKHSAKNFIVNDECNACGICRRVCPVANISGAAKPEYADKCEFCLACVHNCPQTAIHLKNELSEKRFRHAGVQLLEIINANNQT
jgi:ferredoxin